MIDIESIAMLPDEALWLLLAAPANFTFTRSSVPPSPDGPAAAPDDLDHHQQLVAAADNFSDFISVKKA